MLKGSYKARGNKLKKGQFLLGGIGKKYYVSARNKRRLEKKLNARQTDTN